MKKIPVFPIGYGWMVKMKLFDKYFQPYAERQGVFNPARA